MKLIFVTGGVVSGLGKGITAASIGRLLKGCKYKVNMIKMDPYLQVDAGTMSPFEHGEVFVTDDGAETDLDIGHYERFINESLNGKSNITTGQIYGSVIEKERRGDYLGKTVQVVPHITNEIKDRITEQAQGSDFTIIEVGGTVGDIESLPFLEAIRQLKSDLGENNVIYIHVAPVLYLGFSGETKTKPIQHSVRDLREVGIKANFIVCRTQFRMDQSIKDKIALLCDVSNDNIIEAIDAKSIYEVPIIFANQKFCKKILNKLGIKPKNSSIKKWEKAVNNILNPLNEITIGIIGKYAQFQDAYLSLTEAITHAGANNGVKININWIQSDDIENTKYEQFLKEENNKGKLDGIIVPGGFGSRGFEGKINAIKFVRENNIPFLGICLGLQAAVVEYTRNICGIKKANSSEFIDNLKDPVIDFLPDQKNIKNMGGTMRLGKYDAILSEGSLAYKLYGKKIISERHRHRYEVNPNYHKILKENGLIISGLSPDGKLAEFIELKNHPFFIATQAHPEFKSRIDNVHPLFDGLVKAILNK